MNRCSHVYRSGPLLPERFGTQIGGVSLGQCKNEALEGLVVCHEHVNKDALFLIIDNLRRDVKRLKQVLES